MQTGNRLDRLDSHGGDHREAQVECAKGTIRLSVGRYTTAEEIDQALDEIKQVVNHHDEAASVGN